MDVSITPQFDEELNCWNVVLSGEFDIFNATDLKTTLTELTKEKNADLTIDCAAVSFMDSTALGALVAVLKNVKTYDGKMTLENLKPGVYKLFKITNLDKIFVLAGEPDGTL